MVNKLFQRQQNKNLYAWLMLSPFLISFSIFFIYAFAKTVYLSFTYYDLFSNAKWSGLINFVTILNDELFLHSLLNTIQYSVISSIIQIFSALFFAIKLKSKNKLLNFFRAIFYFPALFSVSAITIVFIFLFQSRFTDMLINTALQVAVFLLTTYLIYALAIYFSKVITYFFDCFSSIHQGKLYRLSIFTITIFLTFHNEAYPVISNSFSIDFLYGRNDFLFFSMPLWGLILQSIVINVPIYSMFLIKVLREIPPMLYDAAKADGASKFAQLRYITVPFLVPTMYILFILSVISSVQLFDQILFLGSPIESKATIALYIYQKIFPYNSNPLIGAATAASVIFALTTLTLVSYPIFKLTRK